ncbi:MAG: hypothetical protein HY738_20835 [Bacteroidia bacterium]|nr:hypothetical protein [Bacteroidia bacterium]
MNLTLPSLRCQASRLLYIILIFFCYIFNSVAYCQQEVKSDTSFKRNPKLAGTLSAVIPGLGQAYNKKYWKIPIIYAGFGALGYLFNNLEKNYVHYRLAYNTRKDGDPNTIDEYNDRYSESDLMTIRDEYRRYHDFCFIGLTGVYLLNIVDAIVDGYLYDYDVSDNLSLIIEPSWQPYQEMTIGITYSIKF